MTIKELVTNTTVRFLYYRKNELWYSICCDGGSREKITKDIFVFPVPIEDCGDGTFYAEDKAILFMRYIRQQLEKLNQEKTSEILKWKGKTET